MTDNFLVLAGPVAAMAALYLLPGLLMGWALRLRSAALLAVVPLLPLPFIGVMPMVYQAAGIRWGLASYLAAVAVGVAICALVGWLSRNSQPMWKPTGSAWWVVAGTVIAGAIHGFRSAQAWQTPDAIGQAFDMPFHLNYIRWIVDSGNGSSLNSAVHVDPNNEFYPSGLQDLLALVVHATGTSPSRAVLAAILVITCVVWPLAVAALMAVVTGSWRAAGIGALLSCCLPQMPTTFIWFGIILANLWGYSLLPGALALMALIAFRGRGASQFARFFGVLAVGVLGLALIHPNAVFSLLVLSIPIVVIAFYWWGRAAAGRLGRPQLAGGIAGAVLACLLYVGIERASMKVEMVAEMRTKQPDWGPPGTVWQAFLRGALTIAHPYEFNFDAMSVVLTVLTVVGVVWSLRRRETAWLPFAQAIAGFLFVVAFRVSSSLRQFIIGVWYADVPRLSTLMGIVAVPLVVMGILAVSVGIARLVRRFREDVRPGTAAESRVVAIAAVVLAVLTFVGAQADKAIAAQYRSIHDVYAFDDAEKASLLSLDELALLERLDTHVPEGDKVIGSPWTGASLSWAIADRQSVFSHAYPTSNEDYLYLAENLNKAKSDPKVCQIVDKYDIGYALDFGHDYLWGADEHGNPTGWAAEYPGLEDLAQDGVATVVDEQGDAKLLEITACR